MNKSRLNVKKTIYAKPKGFDQSLMKKVLKVEVEKHLSEHPDLVFKGTTDGIKNADKSITYTLLFSLAALEKRQAVSAPQ